MILVYGDINKDILVQADGRRLKIIKVRINKKE